MYLTISSYKRSAPKRALLFFCKADTNLTQQGAKNRENQGKIRKAQKCHKFKYKQKVPKTTEKPVILGTYWQGHKDLNPEPTVLETAALPIELYPYMKRHEP